MNAPSTRDKKHHLDNGAARQDKKWSEVDRCGAMLQMLCLSIWWDPTKRGAAPSQETRKRFSK
jgi:hypothetical protein